MTAAIRTNDADADFREEETDMKNAVRPTSPTPWIDNARCVVMGLSALATLVGSLWVAGIF